MIFVALVVAVGIQLDVNAFALVFGKHVVRANYRKNFLVDVAFDRGQIVDILFRTERVSLAAFSGARRASDSVDIIFRLDRKIVVHDHRQIVNVDSARGDIRCDEH